jgi:hypothetical protein
MRCIFTLAAVLTVASGILAVGSGQAGAATTCHVGNARTQATFTTLQEAVNSARSGDTLWIRGVCMGHTRIGAEGQELSLVLRGRATDQVPHATLDARGTSRVLSVIGKTDLRIVDLTLPGGAASRGSHAEHLGGGIYKTFGKLVLAGSTSITGNQARIGGGVYQFKGTLILAGTASITHNTWYRAPGHGGCYGGGVRIGTGGSGRVVMKGSSLIARNSSKTMGGGILAGASTTVVMRDDASIRRNTAGVGAGIRAGSDDELWLYDRSSVVHNVATKKGGGVFGGTVYACSALARLSPNDPDDPPPMLPCP